jgi:peptidoglycan DL-endopeptidase CwlO
MEEGVPPQVESARSLARRSLIVASSLVAALAISVIPSGTATAAPTAGEIDRAINDLGVKLNAINEQYNDANALLKASRAKQATLQAQIKAYSVKTDAYEQRVNKIGAAAYVDGRPGMMRALITGGSPQNVLDQLQAYDIISADQQGDIDALLEAKKPLDAAKRKLDAEVQIQAKQEKVLRDRKAALNKDLAKWKALKAQQQPRASRSSTRTVTPVNVPVSGKGATVVAYARAQIGDPYVFGADGPDSFDCSGLTLAAWAQVGVSMPHSARQQYAAFPKVSKANLRPGDIVFFYDPISHNGIYIGAGMVIHAPQPGESVEQIAMSSMPDSGAVRPG